MEPYDFDLIERIQRGDVEALSQLYARYAPILFLVALRILGSREDAEDAVHDAFIVVRERAASFSAERGSVATWFVTIARNLCVDEARRRARRNAVTQCRLVHDAGCAEDAPDDLLSDAREHAKVRSALRTLPPAQQNTIFLAFTADKTYREIAEADGVPLGTIKSRVARARSVLRSTLTESPGLHRSLQMVLRSKPRTAG